MTTQEMRNLNEQELASKLVDMQAEYFNLKDAVRLGMESNTSRLKALRRQIAQVKTIARERR